MVLNVNSLTFPWLFPTFIFFPDLHQNSMTFPWLLPGLEFPWLFPDRWTPCIHWTNVDPDLSSQMAGITGTQWVNDEMAPNIYHNKDRQWCLWWAWAVGMSRRHTEVSLWGYRQISNIRHTFVGNWIVDHSDVVGASPVGAAPTTS